MEVPEKITKLLIFIPKIVTKSDFCYLNGETNYRDCDQTLIYFVTGFSEELDEKSCIGVWTKSYTSSPTKTNFVNVFQNEGGRIYTQTKHKYPLSKILIFYEISEFSNEVINENPEDLFVILNNKFRPKLQNSQNPSLLINFFAKFLKLLMVLMPILKYSSTATHLKIICERFLWALGDQKIKSKNFFFSILLDIFLGLGFLYFLLGITSTNDFPDLFLWVSELCVNGLRNLLQWLAGSPAGFKLNKQLNGILAKFFIFYTDIWWIFLVLISPGLGVVFRVFIFLGQFGVTLQAAILSDILALVSFHAYCIYAFAARLYSIQLSGLTSLWRLFLGRKWNPLRDKVDSCQYSAEQLFVGTLLFTILLFLLPTALIYYVVFSTVILGFKKIEIKDISLGW